MVLMRRKLRHEPGPMLLDESANLVVDDFNAILLLNEAANLIEVLWRHIVEVRHSGCGHSGVASLMDTPLTVEHQDGEILVTRSGTAFSARYHKPDGDPILRLLAATVDPEADREAIFRFRATAFAAAMNRARELGWIV